MLEKISIKGVCIGALVDVVGSGIWNLFFLAYLVMRYDISLVANDTWMQQIDSIIHTDPSMLALSILVGGSFSIIGGYVAARVANKYEYLNGSLSAFLSVAGGVIGIIAGSSAYPLYILVMFLFLNPLLGALGGAISRGELSKKS